MKRLHISLLSAALLAASALSAATAQAAPQVPSLYLTSPKSPGTSLTPRIFGDPNDGIATRLGRTAPVARVARAGPGVTITLYTDPSCSGPVAATGTGSNLLAGMLVSVAPDSTTTFYATSTDSSNAVSACSTGLDYQQVSTGPGPPDVTSVTPVGPANNNTPLVRGNAAAGSTVSVYTDLFCTGTPVGSGDAADFSAGGIPVSVPDDTTQTLYAVVVLAGINSVCSATSATYEEDSTGPKAPQLHTVPGARANKNDPRVAGNAPGATLVRIYLNPACNGVAIAGGSPSEFGSGFVIPVADNTTTNFYGLAIDAAGNSSACSSVPATYVEDSSAPRARITLGPGVKTRSRSPIFRFTDITGDPGTTFLCKIDKRAWKSCHAPVKLKRLRYGRHTFRVKASDAAGNKESVGAKRRFKTIRPRKAKRH